MSAPPAPDFQQSLQDALGSPTTDASLRQQAQDSIAGVQHTPSYPLQDTYLDMQAGLALLLT